MINILDNLAWLRFRRRKKKLLVEVARDKYVLLQNIAPSVDPHVVRRIGDVDFPAGNHLLHNRISNAKSSVLASMSVMSRHSDDDQSDDTKTHGTHAIHEMRIEAGLHSAAMMILPPPAILSS